jgi:four helix bundle protein
MSQADELQARTDAFADLSLRFVQGLPDTRIAQRIAGQYQDSSTSTAANYRAARRARSHDEFVAKLGIVSEEADESVFWLTRLLNAKIHSTTVELGTLLSEAEQLARIFGASHRTAKSANVARRPMTQELR